ncbi:Gfo/Idh/MocA family protein [Cellulomonas endophytica]|uniref:Gfo/Idh/MocA family protein n=1 Tax=Cellulomonas endophytica TaxID=2494735 RepID=UPI0013E947F4|nr:Gfo/Idh/MocA family oxidoreductase [Cellulomonas endophytica]
MRQPRIAVVGTGWWSANHHVPSLASADGAELLALCDPDLDRAREVAARHGDVPVVADLDALLALRPDGVVVATPHTTHHGLAARALDAGVAALVEKPLATTAEDAFDLVARAERSGAHLSVGYTDQYVPVAALVRRAVREDIGELVQVMGEFTSATESLFARAEAADARGGAPEDTHPGTYGADAGGGQAHTQLTHLLGMVCWVTGREVAEVAAVVDRRGYDVDVDDAAVLRLRGGGTGVVTSSGMAGGQSRERRSVRYLGTRGVVDQDLTAGRATVRRADGALVELRTHEDEDPPRPWLPARRFADVLAGRATSPAPGRDGAAAEAAVEAVLRSAAERRFVEVPALPPAVR